MYAQPTLFSFAPEEGFYSDKLDETAYINSTS